MFTVSWIPVGTAAAAGALGAWLANRGIAVYHDGLRALVPQMLAGNLTPRQLLASGYRLTVGLLVGFVLPISLVSGFLLVHALWLGTDLIGIWFAGKARMDYASGRKSWLEQGEVVATGALLGAVLMLGLQGFNHLTARLPVTLDALRLILSQPVVFSFAAFPAIALAYQNGIRTGVLAFAGILLVRMVAAWLGLAQPDVWALATGLLLVAVTAWRERPDVNPSNAPQFTDQIDRLRRHLPLIAILGALYGLAARQLVLVEGPQSLFALSGGSRTSALALSLARALAFTPIKGLSVLTSGVHVTDGLGFAWTAGLAAPQAWSAALLGGLTMCLEVLALGALGRLLQHAPGLVKAAGNLRTAMTRLLEASLLVGGMLATENLAPGYGYLFTAGFYLLNEAAGAPLLRMSIGPLGVLIVWASVNAFALIR